MPFQVKKLLTLIALSLVVAHETGFDFQFKALQASKDMAKVNVGHIWPAIGDVLSFLT
jgi:hypothetical protein